MIAPDDASGEDDPHGAEPRPTRTGQTRAAAAVNRLGIQLTTLTPEDLDHLELPEHLRQAIDLTATLSHGARRRQQRLVGQLLRAEDHEAIERRVAGLKGARRDVAQREKVTERWLARLLEDGDAGVEALIAEHPDADRQRLRLLARSARRDPEAKKAKRARRELLQAIRALRA